MCYTGARHFRLRRKKNTRVSTKMLKKIRVGRSENLFIFCLIFVCWKKTENVYWG